VRELLRGRCRFELGSPSTATSDRVAVLAHWARDPVVTRSVGALVRSLQEDGYVVVVSSTCGSPDALGWPDDIDRTRLVVIRRPNSGYDFGSWSIALDLVPRINAAPRVLLLNDSMAGPFDRIDHLLADFDQRPVDVWGLTDGQQFGRHLQSYFLGFRDGVLAERPLARFWAGIRHIDDKQELIFRNELGLSALLRDEGYAHAPAIPHEKVVRAGDNPVIKGWRKLLELGVPFVKREILRDPDVAPGGRSAPGVLRARFGIEVRDWVEDRVA
jgi:lipopolysaccharide biosynthesis protein